MPPKFAFLKPIISNVLTHPSPSVSLPVRGRGKGEWNSHFFTTWFYYKEEDVFTAVDPQMQHITW